MLNNLAERVYKNNKEKGFWEERDKFNNLSQQWISKIYSYNVNESFSEEAEAERINKALKSESLMLIVSELSEALEAIRKDTMDDKLTEHKGEDVELVDALIRILDYAGGYGIDLDTILEKKLKYNNQRPYKHGKSF